MKPAPGREKGSPTEGIPSDYTPRWDGRSKLCDRMVVALLPVMVTLYWSDTERGKRLRHCHMTELLGDEETIALLAISQAHETINRMEDPYQ